jgi:hypothetical protein
MVTKSFTLYKGFQIHMLEEGDFKRDAQGRYVVRVHIRRPGFRRPKHFEVPDCFAPTLEQAQQMSIEQAMRIIDAGLDPSSKQRRDRRG